MSYAEGGNLTAHWKGMIPKIWDYIILYVPIVKKGGRGAPHQILCDVFPPKLVCNQITLGFHVWYTEKCAGNLYVLEQHQTIQKCLNSIINSWCIHYSDIDRTVTAKRNSICGIYGPTISSSGSRAKCFAQSSRNWTLVPATCTHGACTYHYYISYVYISCVYIICTYK